MMTGKPNYTRKMPPICCECDFYIAGEYYSCEYKKDDPDACFFTDQVKDHYSEAIFQLREKNRRVWQNSQRNYRRNHVLRRGIDKAIDELPLNPFDAIRILKETLGYKKQKEDET